ncbi:stage II sporulation protein M [Halomicroarcula sp. F13]|uniref:Stage II sporulation protein M n=1 Tax=Haloarcula rubra TaxID=2487747 RepID=A0AAW4PKT5_9EURY|nr:stage II sporulation protein M [Halomicroarcula rubra]MBX0321700.1 stage II sporulation protein M [Halomicroarcula rubra]
MSSRYARARAVCRRWLVLYVPIAALLLGVSTAVGFLLGSAVPIESLPTAAESGSNPFFPDELTTYAIAVNNLVAMFVLLLGAVSLGIVTVAGLVLNGLLIGAVVGIAVQQVDPIVVVALILPHGVVEIPALLVVAAVGLRFARLTVRYLRGLEDELVTERDLREAGWLVAVAVVMILVAAYVEATLTLEIAERVAGRELGSV